MFAGHYSVAFAARAAEPRAPLWALVLAVMAVDVVWAALVLLGVERVRIDPGLPSNPMDLAYMPYTHGLPATALWTLGAFAAARLWLRRTGPALAIALAVASHWWLDLLVHRPDLPLWGDAHKVGLGLWNHPLAALLLELALLVSAALWLARSPGWPSERRRALLGFAAGLAAAQLVFFAGPPPPGPGALAATALVFFGGAAWIARRVEGPRPLPPP